MFADVGKDVVACAMAELFEAEDARKPAHREGGGVRSVQRSKRSVASSEG